MTEEKTNVKDDGKSRQVERIVMPNKKVRIIKRINVDGRIQFVIQQKHFLFRWLWVDAWINSMEGAACKDYFNTLEEAKKNLCYFDGLKPKDVVISA